MTASNKSDILKKVHSFCAYQDRSSQQVVEKLEKLGAPVEWREEILEQLKAEKFLDDRRFSISYARGRFYQKKWGRIKILRGLLSHGIDESLAEEALREIGSADYYQLIRDLILQKRGSFEKKPGAVEMDKTYRYLRSKGFEVELILPELKKFDWSGD